MSVHPQLAQDALNATRDYTGAAANMQSKVLNPIYDNLNELTGGKFRTLNADVQAAKGLARGGEPEAVANYKNKLAEMNDLLDQETGGLPKDYLQKVKAAWRQQNVLDDIGWRLDRNLGGVPGASKASQVQRGINGRGLMRDLQAVVKIYGRDTIDQTLGTGRLENLEEIADRNMTDRQRAVFNGGIRTVAQELAKLAKEAPSPALNTKEIVSQVGKRALAMTAGGAAAILSGHSPYWGVMAGEAGYETTQAVFNAIKTNPKIAQNFLFALESGATPARYGPFIATLIQQSETEASEEKQTEGEDQQ